MRGLSVGSEAMNGRAPRDVAAPGSGPEEHRTDRVLMSDFAHRDRAAADELLRRFAPAVYGMGMTVLGDPDVAADLLEATFVRLWRTAPRYLREPVALDVWVLCQALSEALQMSHEKVAAERDGPSTRKEGRNHAAPIRTRAVDAGARTGT